MYIAIVERNSWEREVYTRYIPETPKNLAFAKRFEELVKKYNVAGYSVQYNMTPKESDASGYLMFYKTVDAEFNADDLPDKNDPWKLGSCQASAFEDYIYKTKWLKDHR